MNRALTILCAAIFLTFTIGCAAGGHIPGTILNHSSISCAPHGGTKYISITAGGQGNLVLDGVYVVDNNRNNIPCTDVLVMCGDNFTELNYHTCDAKWWPSTKEG